MKKNEQRWQWRSNGGVEPNLEQGCLCFIDLAIKCKKKKQVSIAFTYIFVTKYISFYYLQRPS